MVMENWLCVNLIWVPLTLKTKCLSFLPIRQAQGQSGLNIKVLDCLGVGGNKAFSGGDFVAH